MANLFPRSTAIVAFPVPLLDETGEAYTGAAPSVYVTKDNGAQALATNTPVHVGRGQWTIDITATERDAKITSLLFVKDDVILHQATIVSDDQLGAGANEVTVSFGSLAAYATIWINDAGGNVVASGTADGSGDFAVYLNTGTYYAYGVKPGVNFTNPTQFTVS